jgi:hypothetical protein
MENPGYDLLYLAGPAFTTKANVTPLLRSTAGNIFSMYLANIFFGEFRAGNLNAKFNINSYIRNKEGWLK